MGGCQDAWRTYFDEHGPTREDGAKGGQVFRTSDDPNEVVVFVEWDSKAAARAFVESGETPEAIEKSGVVGEPEVLFLDDTDEIEI
ncbi:putative quinol monooxygenase [Haladaptatus sp. NG-SE-30]